MIQRRGNRKPSVSKSETQNLNIATDPHDAPTVLPKALVIGAFTNAGLIWWSQTFDDAVPAKILVTAQVFAAICGYRCIFPNRYNGCVVLRDNILSSIAITRIMATFAEMFLLYQLSVIATDLNHIREDGLQVWIDFFAWTMVISDAIAQCCVWSSLVLETDILMWYEEANWALMFTLNTIINLFYFFSGDYQQSDPRWQCIWLSLLFGAIYLPWQIGLHLPMINSDERKKARKQEKTEISCEQVSRGCFRAWFHRKPSQKYKDWGRGVGAFWMFGYWILEPIWPMFVAYSYSQAIRSAQ